MAARSLRSAVVTSHRKQSGSMLLLSLGVILIAGILLSSSVELEDTVNENTVLQIYDARAEQAASALLQLLIADYMQDPQLETETTGGGGNQLVGKPNDDVVSCRNPDGSEAFRYERWSKMKNSGERGIAQLYCSLSFIPPGQCYVAFVGTLFLGIPVYDAKTYDQLDQRCAASGGQQPSERQIADNEPDCNFVNQPDTRLTGLDAFSSCQFQYSCSTVDASDSDDNILRAMRFRASAVCEVNQMVVSHTKTALTFAASD